VCSGPSRSAAPQRSADIAIAMTNASSRPSPHSRGVDATRADVRAEFVSAGIIRASVLRQNRVEPRDLIGGERKVLTILADEIMGELQRPHQALV
jgi:hypothetical protein